MVFNLESQISWLSNFLTRKKSNGLITRIGDDDCAHFKYNKEIISVTSDFLNSNPLITRLEIGGPRELGKLLIASSLSDLIGSGSLPKYLLINLCIPRKWGAKEYRALISGAKNVAESCGAQIIGGDSKYGMNLSLCATAIGFSTSMDSLFIKTRANPDQDIWIATPVGACTGATIAATKKKQRMKFLEWIKKTLGRPSIPIKKSINASKLKGCFGGIDISDGLGADLTELCKSSDVGAIIYSEMIPISPMTRSVARSLKIDPIDLAFGIGGDFSFVITADRRFRSPLESYGFSKIGITTSSKNIYISSNDKLKIMTSRGHNDAYFDDIVKEALAFTQHAG